MKSLKGGSGVLLLFFAVVLAWLTPEWGASGGHLNSGFWMRVGVVFIFFVQGLGMSAATMGQGLRFWKFHIFVQFWVFFGLPAMVLFGLAIAGGMVPEGLRLGIFFLAILPTTISSAIALVAQGGGNTEGAVFNTLFANLAAVFVVPLWLFAMQGSLSAVHFEFWPTLTHLIKLLLLPFAIGYACRWLHLPFEKRLIRWSKPLSSLIVAFMVYAAFATSFRDQVWVEVGFAISLKALLLACMLLLGGGSVVLLSVRYFFDSPRDRMAAFFTSSQKSLAVGVPYSVTLFAMLPETGDSTLRHSIIILPLLFYHPIQLILAALLLQLKTRVFGEQKN